MHRRLNILFIILFAFTQISRADELEKILQQKVTTSFVSTTLDNVVRFLAKQYGINVVISGEANARVTISLENVPLSEAFNSILKANGYHYVIGENVLIIKPEAMKLNGDLTSQVFDLRYLEGFSLKHTLEPMLSERGKVEALKSENADKETLVRSNRLVVTDVWENVRQIGKVIRQMDKPERQVQIEVRLVEKLVGNEKKVGIDYPTSVSVKMTGAETNAPITQGQNNQQGASLLSAWYQLPNSSNDLNLGVLTFDNLKATLDILATDNTSKLISNPRVTTLNNRRASIKIGTIIPIKEISRGVSGDIITYKDKDVSIRLDVIPLIGDDDYITLQVHPVLEEIVGYTGDAEAPQPITSKREVEATVILKDGETLVLGGLVKDSKSEIINKIWLLGDIPLLGYLFQHRDIKVTKNDLLIFITTKIINEAKDTNPSGNE